MEELHTTKEIIEEVEKEHKKLKLAFLWFGVISISCFLICLGIAFYDNNLNPEAMGWVFIFSLIAGSGAFLTRILFNK